MCNISKKMNPLHGGFIFLGLENYILYEQIRFSNEILISDR